MESRYWYLVEREARGSTLLVCLSEAELVRETLRNGGDAVRIYRLGRAEDGALPSYALKIPENIPSKFVEHLPLVWTRERGFVAAAPEVTHA